MKEDQIAYGIIFAIPFLLLTFDWWLDVIWSRKLITFLKIPWSLFVLGWIATHHDWNALVLAVPLGLGMFFQEQLKGIWHM